jgi:hypothetical protein
MVIALRIFGVAGFAVAQPLLSLLGEHPTYFVAHGTTGVDLLLFTTVVVTLPALLFIVPVLAVGLVSAEAGRMAAAVAIGILGSIALLRLLDSVAGFGWLPYASAALAGTVAVAWAFVRFRAVRLFALYTSPAPILFAASFLFLSPARALLDADDADALAAVHSARAPLVVVVFDELPLGALLDDSDQIAGDRFPGFARVAATSTWYPNATTVAPWTNLAVPSILTGLLPDPSLPPVAGQYPRSLFTMFGATRELHVTEQVTSLCPRDLCGTSAATGAARASLLRDTAVVALHEILPANLASSWLPAISGSWANFGREHPALPPPTDGADLDFDAWREQLEHSEVDPRSFAGFLSSLGPSSRPGVWYEHVMLPHMPYQFLPDGRRYGGSIPGALSADTEYWSADPLASVSARQRFLLQVMYVDALVGQLWEHLEQQGLLREAMVVVTSDHGISFQPDGHRRGVFDMSGGSRSPLPVDEVVSGAGHDVLPVPLFVKYPGQEAGTVDERGAESIDILPTIADVLDVDVPASWAFDGASLLDRPTRSASRHWITGGPAGTSIEFTPDPGRMADTQAALFGRGGEPHDVYAAGPHRALVGAPVEGVLAGGTTPPDDVQIAALSPGAFADVDLDGQTIPALYRARVAGVEPGTWLALGLNGRIAGVGPVHLDRERQPIAEIMIDPSLLVAGENAVELHLVDPTGRLVRLGPG